MSFFKWLMNLFTIPEPMDKSDYAKLYSTTEFSEPLFSKKVPDEYLVASLSLRSNAGLFMLDHIRMENDEPIYYVRHLSSDALIGMSEGAFQLLFEITK